ncbi:hypothetical protein M5C72_06565 [Companilactobacillus allii]|uniref:Uncharacterized protein n=1 Tax=Companilactobacillus allii TaxID=1847728 RepID=A0A1P8Q4H9_9LACO|nr:hypothetical protein [Companilactobacillus allii]APX72762.1 hypothetical protein BTM29_09465 [Companilactobacillus allii]USQ67550.1 hypothetical protein M5C72_06565 [Companilactobacillus allii]
MDDNKNMTFEDYLMTNSMNFANRYGEVIEWVEKIEVAVNTELNLVDDADSRMELMSYKNISYDCTQILYDLSYEFARFNGNITKKGIGAITLEQAILFQSTNEEDGVKAEFDDYKKSHVNAYDSLLDMIEILNKLSDRYPWVEYGNPESSFKIDLMDSFMMIGQFYFMGLGEYSESDSESYIGMINPMIAQLDIEGEIEGDVLEFENSYVTDAEDAITEGLDRLAADQAGVPYIQE